MIGGVVLLNCIDIDVIIVDVFYYEFVVIFFGIGVVVEIFDVVVGSLLVVMIDD